MATAFTLTDATFRSSRHTTHYWGPANSRRDSAVYSRLRPDHRGGQSAARALRPDVEAASTMHERQCAVDVGARDQGLAPRAFHQGGESCAHPDRARTKHI